VDGQASEVAAGVQESRVWDAVKNLSATNGVNPAVLVGRVRRRTAVLFSAAGNTELLPASIGTNLADALGPAWKVGSGAAYEGPGGCRRSYLEAHEALELGMICNPGRCAFTYEDLLLYRLLSSDLETAARFVRAELGPAIDYDQRRRSELVKTLETYFACCENAKETGAKLFAHPHTITYRIHQVEKLSGRSLKRPEDKLHLQMAVKAFRLITARRPGGLDTAVRPARLPL